MSDPSGVVPPPEILTLDQECEWWKGQVEALRFRERELTEERDELERQVLYTREAAREIIERKRAAEDRVQALTDALAALLVEWDDGNARPDLPEPAAVTAARRVLADGGTTDPVPPEVVQAARDAFGVRSDHD